MAVTFQPVVLNSSIDAAVALADGGKCQILAADDTLIGEFTLGTPAFGGSATGSRDLNDPGALPISGLPGGEQTAAKFIIRQSDDTLLADGTVSEAGGSGDMIISNELVRDGDNLRIISYTWFYD